MRKRFITTPPLLFLHADVNDTYQQETRFPTVHNFECTSVHDRVERRELA